MSKHKLGLGKGLDALINPAARKAAVEEVPVNSEELKRDDGKEVNVLAKIPVEKVRPNPYQPRSEFEPEALEELKRSILENGLIQPVTVRRAENGFYELISGERRFRACSEIGYREIPAYIIKVDSAEGMLALALIENIQREELNPIEVAQAYQRLMSECNLTQEEIAKKVGKNRTTITNSLRLLKLPEVIQKSIAEGKLSAGHARALINLESDDLKIELHDQIIKKQLSVRQVEKIVREISSPKKDKKKGGSKSGEKDFRAEVSREDVEAKLREIFATKVICKQKKDGSGAIVFEFYSEDELERLFELFLSAKSY
jgi:ParB family chromosome partitioning protein